MVSIRMVLIVFVGVFFATGTTIVASFSVFMLPMLKTFHMNRTEISLVVTIFLWSGAIVGPFIAKLMDRFGVRKILVPSTILFGLTILALPLAGSSKWQLYFQYLLVGVTAPSMVGFAKILSLWYHERRGIALATLAIGAAFSAGVMPKIAQTLITLYSWQVAYLLFGLMVLLFGLPAIAMMAEPKLAAGLKNSESNLKKGAPLRAALHNPVFWCITCGLGLVTMCQFGVQTHLVAILDGRGISSDMTAYLFLAISVGSLLGQLTAGSFLDRFDSPRVVLPLMLISLGGLMLFQYSNNFWVLAIALVLFALGAFGETGTAPYLITRYFGLDSFASIFAINFMISIIFFGVSPVVSGAIFDLSGSYHIALVFYMFLLCAATMLLFFMRQYEYDRGGNRLNINLAPSEASLS